MRVVEHGGAGCHHCPKVMIWDFHKGHCLEGHLSTWDFLEGSSPAPALSHTAWCSFCGWGQKIGTQELLGHECIIWPLCSSDRYPGQLFPINIYVFIFRGGLQATQCENKKLTFIIVCTSNTLHRGRNYFPVVSLSP